MAETLKVEGGKRQALEQYLQARWKRDLKPQPVAARGVSAAPAPLTFAQHQVWLHAQLAPHSPAYNEPFTIYRRGSLNVAALERSLTEIIRRHEAWRTTFSLVDGKPMQMVQRPFDVSLPVFDLQNLPDSGREAAALKLAAEDAQKVFDLDRGPLLRARLVRMADDEHRLFLVLHHLVFDGVSGFQVFLPEVAALYEGFSTGKEVRLPELPFQYADYAAWQRKRGDSGEDEDRDLGRRMGFWRKQLEGELPVLQLPTDFQRPGTQSFRGGMETVQLSAGLSESLRNLSQREGVTLFMTMLAAFNTLLARYSGQEEFLVGSITAGRNHPGADKLLGFFLNTVVLRADVSANPTFRQLLRRVRETTLEALSNDEVPLDRLLRELHPHRDLSRNPLFQVLLSLEPAMPAVPDGWDMTVIDVETGTAKFDLCLVLDDRADGVLARFIYSSDLFERRTITRMMGHWQTLLEGVVANPDCRVSELPLLPGQERNQILVEWNRTEKEYPQEYAQQIFAKWAQATPNALAVECDGEGLSYAELDQRANQLAQYLISLGVQPGAPVAICIDRSLEMIVAILGVLKAGAAYVPVDPTYPRERIEFVLADCGAKVLLAQKNRRQHLSFAGTKIVNLDTDWNVIGRQPKAEPPVVEADETPAYIIYTSGSTGTPKGVVVSHRNLAQSTQARLSYYPEPARKFLLLSSVAFDSSIAGIFHALCSGGTLVVPPAGFRYTSSEVAAQIRRGRVTHTLCFPTLYRDLLEQAAAEDLATLRTVIVAGESCPKSLVDLHYSIAPQAALYNEYGPTEATVWCAVHPCEPGEQGNSVPIGEPIANARLYVLDRMMQPVPVNVPGELYIGGSGVALGYLNRPELTAEKFVADPFHPEGRLYKTGDLARHLADGTVEFLGRIDRQVKIHGLRIELEEVEAAIEGHPDVRECVVSMSADVNPQLHAHVVLRTQSFTTATELRAFLRGRMPASMVPAEFEFVASLPRTPNGKIDRPKLSTIERAGKLHEAIAPRDEIEKKLALIWQQVLDAKTNDVTEDFFVLGGHSLLAAQLLVRIEKEFSQELSLAFVFQAPTIEQMADLLRSPRQSLRARAIVPIQPKGARLPLFWVRGGPRFRKLAQTLGSDQPFLGLDLPFTDAHKLPVPYRIEDIAAFLIRAMKEVQPTGPYHLGGLCVNAVIAYEMACQLEAQGESVALLAMLDAHNQAFYKNPLSDGRYTGRIKYHLANLRQMEMRETPAYFFDRLDEARRKIERMSWQFSSSRKNGDESMRNTDSIVHPAFSRFEPRPYGGEIVLLQSSDWPQGPYFDFQLGWQELVGSIEFHQIPGDHALMFIEPNVDLLAARLKSHLTGCVAAATSDCKK